MLRRVLNGIAVAGLATVLLAGTAATQTASAAFADDLSAALASGNPDQFTPAIIELAKANIDKGQQIGKALGDVIDEDQAAAIAGAIAGGVKNAQLSAGLFQGLAEYYPAVAADIAASVITADPTSEVAVTASLGDIQTAAGNGLLGNPGPGAAPINVNSTVDPKQEAGTKDGGWTTRLFGVRRGPILFAAGGGTTSPITPPNDTYTPPAQLPQVE